MALMSYDQIKKILPHRYPFLLVDRVLELEEGKRCKALKNVTVNEAFFQGHFPDNPVMPGVLMLEAMAQTCGITAFSLEENPESKLVLFTGIDKVCFKRPVVPGDQLILEAEFTSRKRNLWVFQARASVEEKTAVQAEIRLATVDRITEE